METIKSLVALDPALNYAFLFKCYVGLSCLALFFAVLQFLFNVTSVTGFWIVPSPALLCLPFMAWRWRQQAAMEGGGSRSDGSSSGTGSESKKEK